MASPATIPTSGNTITAEAPREPVHLLTRRQVEERCGIGRSTLFAYQASGKFPAPVYVTASAKGVRWRSDVIAAWIDNRPDRPT